MFHPALGEPVDDVARFTGHELDVCACWWIDLERTRRQHDHRLVERPMVERQDGVEGSTPHDDGIDRCNEVGVAMILAATGGEPDEAATAPSHESTHAPAPHDPARDGET